MIGLKMGITLIEVGGASACRGLEAEGKESIASYLSPSFLRINSVILKRSAPEPKLPLFPIFIRIIPLLHHANIPFTYFPSFRVDGISPLRSWKTVFPRN
jgi:hypothetical protein